MAHSSLNVAEFVVRPIVHEVDRKTFNKGSTSHEYDMMSKCNANPLGE